MDQNPAPHDSNAQPAAGAPGKLFGKYAYDGLVVNDPGLKKYVSMRPVAIAHSFARHANRPFAKRHVNLVERLANKLMRGGTGEKLGGKIIRTHGKLQGKKSKTVKIVEEALDAVAQKSGENPLQLLVRAVENSAPREETTRVRYGGMSYQLSVDVAPQRRVDLALRNLALAAILSAFGKKTTAAEALANEILLAAAGDAASYSVKRRNETERMAKSAR